MIIASTIVMASLTHPQRSRSNAERHAAYHRRRRSDSARSLQDEDEDSVLEFPSDQRALVRAMRQMEMEEEKEGSERKREKRKQSKTRIS